MDLHSHWVPQVDFGNYQSNQLLFPKSHLLIHDDSPLCPCVLKIYKYTFLLFLLEENGLSLLHLSDFFPQLSVFSIAAVLNSVAFFPGIVWHKHLKSEQSDVSLLIHEYLALQIQTPFTQLHVTSLTFCKRGLEAPNSA